jgi:trk system potassium uptake protein TrkA
MFSFKKKHSVAYGIIGMSRFGYTLASELAENGIDLLVVGKDEGAIRDIRALTENALVVREFSKKALADAGVKNCDVAIVCLDEMTDSILTTLNLVNMNIPRVISIASSAEHGEIMEKLGAEVVYPQRDMAIRLATRLKSSMTLDFVQLNEVINIFKIKVIPPLAGLSVLKSNLRGRFDMNIVAVIHNGKVNSSIHPELVFDEGDTLFLAGSREGFDRMSEWIEQNQ